MTPHSLRCHANRHHPSLPHDRHPRPHGRHSERSSESPTLPLPLPFLLPLSLPLGTPRLQPWLSQPPQRRQGASAPGVCLLSIAARCSRIVRIPIFCLSILAPQLTATAERVTITPPEIGKSITLTFKPDPHIGGNFDSIEINSVSTKSHFIPKVPFSRIPSDKDERLSDGLPEKIPGLKLDPSRFFFRGEYISDGEPHTLLFFVSEGRLSEAAALLVIGFSYLGEPYKVLESENLDLAALQQAGDNKALIIGKATLSQVMAGDGGNGSKAPYATTYDPYSVFTAHMEGKAYYSLAESRRYNEAHYVWAGPHSREDYAVLYNLPKHPRPLGAPASRIDALLGSAKGPKPQ